MIKSQIFIRLCIIIAIFFCIKNYFSDEVLYEIYVKVNEDYFLEGNLDHNTVLLCEARDESNCLNVKKISVQYKNYLIGETENKKYFYINILDSGEKEFSITKKKLKQKFSKRIKFISSQKYMNEAKVEEKNKGDFDISIFDKW